MKTVTTSYQSGRRPVWLAACLTLALGASSCEPPPVTELTVSDSAGVRIVQNPDGPLAVRELSERVRIDSPDPDGGRPYRRLGGVAVHAPTGRVYVADRITSEVGIFSEDGSHIGTFVGQGSEPGRVDNVLGLSVVGDSVFVAGTGSGPDRIQIFDLDGTYLGVWPWVDPQAVRATPRGRDEGGWLAEVTGPAWQFERAAGEIRSDSVRFARFDPATASAGELVLTLPTRRVKGTALAGAMPPPLFDPLPRFDFHSSSGLVYSPAGDLEYVVYDTSGEMEMRVSREFEEIDVSNELVQRYRDAVAEYWSEAEGEIAELARILRDERLPLVDHVSPVGRLLAGIDGSVWIERLDRVPDPLAFELAVAQVTSMPSLPSVWEVFDADGVARFEVTLPPGLTPQVVSESSVWSVEEAGAVAVVRHDLVAEGEGEVSF